MPKKVEFDQAEITIEGKKFWVTHIPTATSGHWYTIQDECEVWGAVAIDLDGTVLGWKVLPLAKYRRLIEDEIKKVFEM